MTKTPFDNVEGAHEYVGLLLEALRQARAEVVHDLERAQAEGAPGRSRPCSSWRGSSSGSTRSSSRAVTC